MSRIAFVTGHSFGCRALEGILSSDEYLSGKIEVPLIIGLSNKKEPDTCGFESPRPLAEAINTVYLEIEDGTLRSVKNRLLDADIDYLLVIGWSNLISEEMLEIPKCRIRGRYGAIGMHPTLLPIGRGRAPLPWSIIQNLTTTGLSVFSLIEPADSGLIIEQLKIPIHEKETSTSLFFKFKELHFIAGKNLASKLSSGDWSDAYIQDESQATFWEKRRPVDSAIDLNMTVSEAISRVRAQKWPYPQTTIQLGQTSYAVEDITRITESKPKELSLYRVVRFADSEALIKLTALHSRMEYTTADGAAMITDKVPFTP